MQTKKLQIKKRVICKYQTPVNTVPGHNNQKLKFEPDTTTTISFPTSNSAVPTISGN